MFKKIFLLTLSLLLSSLIATTVLAANDPLFFNAQITIPGSDFIAGQEKRIADGTALLCDYIVAIYKYAITIVGIFAMLAVAIGGVMWLMAAGNQTRISEGKTWITGGLLGLVLALGAFIVLSTISSDLITCKIDTVRKIEPKELPAGLKNASTVYGKQGLTDKKVTDHLDSSGFYQCCVIKGKLRDSALIFDTNIIRCATYEAANKTVAQAKYDANNKLIGGCDYFYDNYSVYGTERSLRTFFTFDEIFGDNKLILSPREGRRNNEDNSATVYEGRCWENPATKSWCIGADHKDFCSLHDDGKTCLTTAGDWGYCENDACVKCKKHCEACTDDYQCPNQTKSPTTEEGVICGMTIYSELSSNSNDCSDGKCDKEFGGGCP